VDAASEASTNPEFIWGVYLTGVVNPNPPDPWFVLSARYQLEVCREAAANVG